MKKVLCLIVALLLAGSMAITEEVKPWYSFGLPSKLPNPSDVIGREIQSSIDTVVTNEDFAEDLINVTQEEFKKYVDYLVSIGYTIDAVKTPTTFDASNSEGIYVVIMWFEDGRMTVDAMLM